MRAFAGVACLPNNERLSYNQAGKAISHRRIFCGSSARACLGAVPVCDGRLLYFTRGELVERVV